MIKTIFEDNEILVLDKPSGLVVNRSQTQKGETLQDILDDEYLDLDGEDTESEFSQRSGMVHRLDKDTSGVLVIAKTPEAFDNLQKQFKMRTTKKEYVAVVNGVIEDSLIEIDAPIKRHPHTPFKYAVVTGGKESFTKVEKVRQSEYEGGIYTFVKVYPTTGRTHQIRVHLAALGNPVVGDVIYCTQNVLAENQKHFSRLMLHALTLSFQHPITGEMLQMCSELPKEFEIFS